VAWVPAVVTVETAIGCILALILESVVVDLTGCTMALCMGRLLVVGVVIGFIFAVLTASALNL